MIFFFNKLVEIYGSMETNRKRRKFERMKAIKLLLCFLLVASTLLTFSHTSTEAATTFKDINEQHRAYKEIAYLAQGQIISGSSDGRFLPDRNVTRAEAAAFIGRALSLDGTKKNTSFIDVGAGNFASGYIQSAVNKKIISGYSDGTFRPYANVTRGEMAIMISRAFEYNYGNTMSGAAAALTSRGIAQGMADGSFGETQQIIRADFAIFLARAIDYTLRLQPTITFSGETYPTDNSLNVRTGPSTLYHSIGKINKQTKVSIGYKVGNWSLVQADNLIGFVSNSYLANDSTSGEDDGDGTPEVTPPNNSIASQTIVIDPGHGGTDSGSIGFKLKESTVVLDTALRVKDLLAKTPANVKLTRETDVFIPLSGRVTFAKNAKANTFVSIHANAANGKANGSETYYYSRASNPNVLDSKLLATSIQKRLAVAMEHNDRGVKVGDLHVIRENTMPAVLTELGFIDNKEDNAKLASPTYRQKAANAIYLGILDYYKAKGFNVDSLYKVVE